jgi:hypothetical protein
VGGLVFAAATLLVVLIRLLGGAPAGYIAGRWLAGTGRAGHWICGRAPGCRSPAALDRRSGRDPTSATNWSRSWRLMALAHAKMVDHRALGGAHRWRWSPTVAPVRRAAGRTTSCQAVGRRKPITICANLFRACRHHGAVGGGAVCVLRMNRLTTSAVVPRLLATTLDA